MQSFVQNYGYFALFFLAILESACVPIPSEVTFGFAGALCTTAVTGSAQFSVWAVIVVGTVGSLVGSIIAYEVGRTLGRTVVDRWGKWILLTHHDLDRAENWFAKYGAASVLVGRVLPVIRTVISLPAGIAEMRRTPFMWLTVVGSFVWVTLLTLLGKAAGANWPRVSHDFHVAQNPMIVIIVLFIVAFFWLRIRTVRHHNSPSRGRHSR